MSALSKTQVCALVAAGVPFEKLVGLIDWNIDAGQVLATAKVAAAEAAARVAEMEKFAHIQKGLSVTWTTDTGPIRVGNIAAVFLNELMALVSSEANVYMVSLDKLTVAVPSKKRKGSK